MASNKSKHIDSENIDRWASALGFSFPRNEGEEAVFDKLYKGYDFKLSQVSIDSSRLIDEVENEETTKPQARETEWKMVARNFGDLPQNVLDKMKKNQDGKKRGSKED